MTLSSNHPKWAPYFFIAPFFIIFLVFMTYPLIDSLVLAAHQTYGPKARIFIGTKNFYDLWFRDPLFWIAVKNTVVFTLGSVFVQLPLSLALAILLNHPKIKGRTFFRLLYFSPSLVGIVFVAIIFMVVFSAKDGVLNVFLKWLTSKLHNVGILPESLLFPQEFHWLTSETNIMPALILAALWVYVGFNMIYFLAALQSVDKELVEAAAIDGANAWQRFLNITLPTILPVAWFVTLLSIIGSFQLFELPFVLLNGSPGPNNAGLTVVTYLFQKGFQSSDLGYASAIGWSMAIILIMVTLTQKYFFKENS